MNRLVFWIFRCLYTMKFLILIKLIEITVFKVLIFYMDSYFIKLQFLIYLKVRRRFSNYCSDVWRYIIKFLVSLEYIYPVLLPLNINFLKIQLIFPIEQGLKSSPFHTTVLAVRHTAVQYFLVSYYLLLMYLFNFILFVSEP